MYRLMIIVLVLLASNVKCSQNVTHSNESSLEQRVSAMERLIGNMVLGKDNVDSVEILKLSSGSQQFTKNGGLKVIFSAYVSSATSGLSDGYIIRFDSVITNIGDHYNPRDGIFIAPRTGIYMFHWQFISYGNTNINAYTEIIVAGAVKGKSREYVPSGQRQSTANMVVVEVKEKQHVWIQTDTGSMYCDAYSSFNGMLIG